MPATTCEKCSSENLIQLPLRQCWLAPFPRIMIPLNWGNNAVVNEFICTDCGFVQSFVDNSLDRHFLQQKYSPKGSG